MDAPFAFCMIGSFALGVGSLTTHRLLLRDNFSTLLKDCLPIIRISFTVHRS